VDIETKAKKNYKVKRIVKKIQKNIDQNLLHYVERENNPADYLTQETTVTALIKTIIIKFVGIQQKEEINTLQI
jgi:hypothetical protein